MRKFGVPYESSLSTPPQFVAWCKEQWVYFPGSKGGDECEICDREYDEFTDSRKAHLLVTLITWVCPVCEYAFLDWEEFIDHEHSSQL